MPGKSSTVESIGGGSGATAAAAAAAAGWWGLAQRRGQKMRICARLSNPTELTRATYQ